MHRQIIYLLLFLIVSCIAEAQTYSSPSEIPRFQSFLGESKLQGPTSSTAATSVELMNGFTSDRFYVVEEDKIAFNQSGKSMRTELRHEINWTLSEGDRSFYGRLKFVKQTCDQVTVVQIHDDANAGNGPNKPLLRIYKHLSRFPANHLWAAIKTDEGGVNTSHFDLGLAPSDYFEWNVRLEEGNLIIEIDGVEKVVKDVSYWTYPSYWKAGVYLQNDGEATVYFDELYLGENETVLSIPENSVKGISFYPNPTASTIHIVIENDQLLNGVIKLLNSAGQILQEVKILNQQVLLELPGNIGLYFLTIEKNDYAQTFKILKY